MEENVDAPLTLTRLARRAGVSARHLQDLFQETMGARRMPITWRSG
jgi:transcriptional regulator GlxA family with amidase domain